MFWFIVTGVAVYLCYHAFVKPLLYWKNKHVKQPPPIPFLGLVRILLRIDSFADRVKLHYGRFQNVRYSGLYQMNKPTLILKDPELIKQIMVKDFDHFTDHRNFIPEDADELWARNLFILKGDKWKKMRSTLSPVFTGSKMRTMFALVNEAAQNFVKHFEARDDDSDAFDMKDIFTRYTNDVIATCAFGIKCDSLKEKNNTFYRMGKEALDFGNPIRNVKILTCIFAPKLAKLLGLAFFPLKVRNFFLEVIKETLQMRQEKNIIRPDMIHILMEARNRSAEQDEDFDQDGADENITDLDITSQAMVFFAAGFDTVSTLMSFLAYELAVNVDVQQHLISEVDKTLERSNGSLTYEMLSDMKYMDMVISETLRKWPSAVLTDRVCVKPYTIQPTRADEKPVDINIGDILWIPIVALQHDPQFFPNPQRFDPERFSDENKHSVQSYSYLPFGGGPRNCIGSRFALMETKTVCFNILSKFEFQVVERTRIPLKISKTQGNLAAEGGIWLALKRRNRA